MATISSNLGLGSGLPLEQLLADMRALESKPLEVIKGDKSFYETKLSAYGLIQSAVEELQKTIATLGDPKVFGALKGSVTGGEQISVAVNSDAIPGQYTVDVETLATNQTLVAGGVEDRTAANGEGGVITVTLADGSVKTLDMTGGDTSLEGLVEAINADSTLGMRATMVNDGSGLPHRLLLTSNKTGTEASITGISVAGNATLQGLIGFEAGTAGNMEEIAAQDATVRVNNILITSSTNTIKDAIEGVTLTLSEVTTTPLRLNVAADTATPTNAVQTFVTAYNNLYRTITGLTGYDVEAARGSVLTGDSTARTVQSRMRDVLNTVLPDGVLRTLPQMGISTDVNDGGALAIDLEEFKAALADNPNDVARLFSGENGVAAKLKTVTDSILGSGGLLANTTKSIQTTLGSLDEQYERTSLRIESTMERYRQQFIALDATVARMGGISDYLTTQLSMLGNQSDQN